MWNLRTWLDYIDIFRDLPAILCTVWNYWLVVVIPIQGNSNIEWAKQLHLLIIKFLKNSKPIFSKKNLQEKSAFSWLVYNLFPRLDFMCWTSSVIDSVPDATVGLWLLAIFLTRW